MGWFADFPRDFRQRSMSPQKSSTKKRNAPSQGATKPRSNSLKIVHGSDPFSSLAEPDAHGVWTPPTSTQYTIDDAFPDIDPGMRPFGQKILLQVRQPRKKSAGGIHYSDDSQDTEKWNTTIAKVIALGPGAFRNRDTMELWPEGEWAKVGDYVWCPKYGGQRHEPMIPGTRERAMFVLIRDLDLQGACTIDPRDVVAYLR